MLCVGGRKGIFGLFNAALSVCHYFVLRVKGASGCLSLSDDVMMM